MLERSIEENVIPYCLAHNIGIVPFSTIASGFLSGKVTVQSDFSHSDDVRKYVPQLQKENMEANQPILDLLDRYAKSKNATKAQISLSWILHKYPNVVPIPGSKNQERIQKEEMLIKLCQCLFFMCALRRTFLMDQSPCLHEPIIGRVPLIR